jgi:hypothetical protein
MLNNNSIVNVVESTIKDGASQKLSNVVVMYMFQIHVVVNVGNLEVKWMFQTYVCFKYKQNGSKVTTRRE